MSTSTNTITTEQLAREMRKHPETVRWMARDGRIPSVKQYDGTFRFDRVAVFESLIKDSIIESLQHHLQDPALPQTIRSNITQMRDGVLNGWLSVDQVGELMHAMKA